MNSLQELSEFIYERQEKLQQKDLESYLLSLYKELTDNQPYYLNTLPSLSVIATLLETSLNSAPAVFDET